MIFEIEALTDNGKDALEIFYNKKLTIKEKIITKTKKTLMSTVPYIVNVEIPVLDKLFNNVPDVVKNKKWQKEISKSVFDNLFKDCYVNYNEFDIRVIL